MAGTLRISQELCWMPAAWVYDNALEGIAEMLGESEPDLRHLLLASLTQVNSGYLDLERCQSSELRRIDAALACLIDKTLSAGPSVMHNPSFYDGYVQQMHELQALLRRRLNE